MTCKTTSLLAAYLEDSKDTDGVLALIRDKYPLSMSTYLTMIRKDWLTSDIPGEDYRNDFTTVMQTVAGWKSKSDKTEVKLLENAIEQLRAFDAADMTRKYVIQRSLKTRNYTGHAATDALLLKVRILPDYIEKLRMNSDERIELQRKSADSLVKKSSSSFTVSAAVLLDKVRATLVSRTSNVFDLACALSIVTGRRMIEVFRTGQFKAVSGDALAASFAGQAKKQDLKSVAYNIPLLAPFDHVTEALNRLRISKNTEDLNNSEVNLRYSSSCNAAARRLLGEGRRFHDCRAVYGVLSFTLAMPHTLSLNLWLCRALGHSSLTNSLNYSSIHVIDVREEDKRQFVFDA